MPCFWTVVLEKTLESPLDCKEIKPVQFSSVKSLSRVQPVHPKGYQSWIFIGRTDAEAEALILRPPDVKNCLIWKYLDIGKDWRHEEKGTTESEMVEWLLSMFQELVMDRELVSYCMGLQTVGHDWMTELNWLTLCFYTMYFNVIYTTFLFPLILPPLFVLHWSSSHVYTLCINLDKLQTSALSSNEVAHSDSQNSFWMYRK